MNIEPGLLWFIVISLFVLGIAVAFIAYQTGKSETDPKSGHMPGWDIRPHPEGSTVNIRLQKKGNMWRAEAGDNKSLVVFKRGLFTKDEQKIPADEFVFLKDRVIIGRTELGRALDRHIANHTSVITALRNQLAWQQNQLKKKEVNIQEWYEMNNKLLESTARALASAFPKPNKGSSKGGSR